MHKVTKVHELYNDIKVVVTIRKYLNMIMNSFIIIRVVKNVHVSVWK